MTVERSETRVADLVRLADEVSVIIESVDLRRPNLEMVFLSLTGTTIQHRNADPAVRAQTDRGGATSPDTRGCVSGMALEGDE